MQVNIIKLSQWRIPRSFVQAWIDAVAQDLRRQKILAKGSREIQVVFVEAKQIRQLNHRYRGRNKPTDILSFAGTGDGDLGELVLCGEILEKQSREHNLSFQEELGYMLIHGILHLLGYEHEKGGVEARRMFALQDEVFERLCARRGLRRKKASVS